MKPRLIVYYLPHTEWTNVGRAKPLLKGHYQPHLPTDTGFYDLRLPEARQMQADMAKEYGIYDFCYVIWHIFKPHVYLKSLLRRISINMSMPHCFANSFACY